MHSPIRRYVLQHKINTKIKPGLVASYDIRSGNREGLFWFWRFINLSLKPTYLLRHALTDYTYIPGTHTGLNGWPTTQLIESRCPIAQFFTPPSTLFVTYSPIQPQVSALSLTNLRDALHHGKCAANQGGRSV